MINFKKGPALSLRQTNFVAKAVSGQNVEAGHVVRLNDNAGVVEVLKGAAASPATSEAIYGFAINDQTSGDVIESGKLGVYALDGASVVETDKVEGSISSASYPIGKALTANTNGNVKVAAAGDKVIGWVEGIRSLPGKVVTLESGQKIQGAVTFLGIKLNS